MTTNEIRNLIQKKLVGQGSMIDVGGVLPDVLLNLLDLIEQGGGTSDAVQYIPQILTLPQQMQARKNQGLYYSEETPAGVVTWDGNTSGLEYLDIDGNPEHYMYKVADSPTNIVGENFLSMTNSSGTEIAIAGNADIQVNEMGSSYKELIPDIEVTGSAWVTASEVANSGGIIVSTGLILHNPASPDTDIVFPAGIYFSPNLRAFNYSAVEEVHQIPAKYIPQTIPAVKIEIPSNDKVSYGIGYVLLSNYVTNRDVVFSIEGKTINQVSVRNMLDTTSTGDVWDFGTGNTYNFDTSGYYLVQIEVQETAGSVYYYATVFVETVNQ